MRHLELHRLKKRIGKLTFGLFFPNENKRLNQKHGVGKQLDLVLVSFPAGKKTQTVNAVRNMTGWSTVKSADFVKKGDYPKVVIYNVDPRFPIISIEEYLSDYIVQLKNTHNIIFQIV